MYKWKLEYELETEKWLNKLTQEQLKSVAKELKLLELCGNHLKLPHSKPLGRKLFELRERIYGYRIYYEFLSGNKIVLLTAGDKKTQKRDIKKAYKKMLNKEHDQ